MKLFESNSLVAEAEETVRIAQEALAAAKEEQKNAVIEAYNNGNLKEKIVSSWHERNTLQYGKGYYCEYCRAVVPNAYKFPICPHCGAEMSNGNFTFKIIPEDPSPVTINNSISNSSVSEDKSIPTVVCSTVCASYSDKLDRLNAAIEISNYLRNKGLTKKDIAQLAGFDQSLIGHWERKVCIPSANMYSKIYSVYKDFI